MKILVTGGAGFIGSHLVDRLVELGHEVIVVDNMSSGRKENVNPNAELYIRDLKDPAWGADIGPVDAVFHFAANPEVRISSTAPRVHFEENVVATFNVLEWARERGVKAVVFASSAAVYGDAVIYPTPEDASIAPVSIYGAAKAAGEVMCATYARLYGIRCLALRYANIIGPRLRHGVIHDLLVKLRKNPHELEVLGDGGQIRSYLYINDAIDATIAAWRKFQNDKEVFLPLNVGNRDTTTVKEVVEVVTKTIGLNPHIVYKPATNDGRGWPGDLRKIHLDIKALEKYTGWTPSLSSREAVKKTATELIKEL